MIREILAYPLIHTEGQPITVTTFIIAALVLGVHYAIRAAFLTHAIEIPFPQQDLRVRSAVAVSVAPGATEDR
jgi:small-conductance mechanosensitive channel